MARAGGRELPRICMDWDNRSDFRGNNQRVQPTKKRVHEPDLRGDVAPKPLILLESDASDLPATLTVTR
jgi:hypothetical protein